MTENADIAELEPPRLGSEGLRDAHDQLNAIWLERLRKFLEQGDKGALEAPDGAATCRRYG